MDFSSLNRELARTPLWSLPEVARLLDVSLRQVELWTLSGELVTCSREGEVRVTRAALFLFLGGQVEPMISAETMALALDVEERTVRGWLQARSPRIPSVKLGSGNKAPRRVFVRKLREWVQRLEGRAAA